jgi:hypothetical protein
MTELLAEAAIYDARLGLALEQDGSMSCLIIS